MDYIKALSAFFLAIGIVIIGTIFSRAYGLSNDNFSNVKVLAFSAKPSACVVKKGGHCIPSIEFIWELSDVATICIEQTINVQKVLCVDSNKHGVAVKQIVLHKTEIFKLTIQEGASNKFAKLSFFEIGKDVRLKRRHAWNFF